LSRREITSHHIYGTEIQEIVDRMKELSAEIEDRAKEMGTMKKLVLRADPQMISLWHKLCVLHMKSLVICEEIGYSDEACMFIKEPQACQTVLGIPREETCCGRFFGLE